MSASLKCTTCEQTENDAGQKLLHCNLCKTPYCSETCQKANWKLHKQLCTLQRWKNKADERAPGPAGLYNPGFEMVNNLLDLSRDDYLHELSERECMNQLIDCFRLRCEDEYKFGGSLIGLYNNEDPQHEFSNFLDLLEQRTQLVPRWWAAEKKTECLRLALDPSKWSCIKRKVVKSELPGHYADQKISMKLQILADKIYGRGFR